MVMRWRPDTCVDGGCLMYVLPGHTGFISFHKEKGEDVLCGLHARLRGNFNTDQELFTFILGECRKKNAAVKVVAESLQKELGVTVRSGEISWRADVDGSFIISLPPGVNEKLRIGLDDDAMVGRAGVKIELAR